MDNLLSEGQTEVDTYHAVFGNGRLDTDWNTVLSGFEQATSTYLAISAPDTHPTQIRYLIEKSQQLVDATIQEITDFRVRNEIILHDAANEAIKRAAEAARKAAQLPLEAKKAIDSVSFHLQATRTRMEGVQPALSTMYKEFPRASSADLSGNRSEAQSRIDEAANYLSSAAQAQGQYDHIFSMTQMADKVLDEADRLIDPILTRLQLLQEIQADPQKRLGKVKFALRDAQKFCVSKHLEKQWAPTLDAQLVRIAEIEAAVHTPHPDYWAYANGLGKVEDSIQAVVANMRQSVRK